MSFRFGDSDLVFVKWTWKDSQVEVKTDPVTRHTANILAAELNARDDVCDVCIVALEAA